MNNAHHNIIGLVLAGGEGRRFGGLDKGLQDYKGQPLIEYAIDSLKQQTDNIIISVNRNHSVYEQYGLDLVSDSELKAIDESQADFQGPLAGLMASIPLLQQYQKDYVLLASCDSPNLTNDYALKLKNELENSTAIAAVVHDGKRRQNMHCLLRCEALLPSKETSKVSSKTTQSIQEFYQNGGRALYRWFEKNEIIEVDFSKQTDCFLNINTREQLQT